MEGDEVAGLARLEQEGARGKQVEDSMVELHCQGNRHCAWSSGFPCTPENSKAGDLCRRWPFHGCAPFNSCWTFISPLGKVVIHTIKWCSSNGFWFILPIASFECLSSPRQSPGHFEECNDFLNAMISP